MPAVDVAYTFPPGQILSAGRSGVTPPGLPAWAAASELHSPLAIPGSSGSGGGALDVYGGVGVRGTELLSMRNGGHEKSDNRVTSIDIGVDSPAWRLRCDPTPVDQRAIDVYYYADGLPTSIHTYDTTFWVPQINRWMQVGQRGTYGNPMNNGMVNAWNPDTGLWDPAGTWATASEGGTSGAFDPTRGRFWTISWQVFDAQTNSYITPEPITSHPYQIRFSTVYDPVRDQMVCIQWGDGFGYNVTSTPNATKWNADGTGVQELITFNPSAAYDQFVADRTHSNGQPNTYPAITHDSVNDCFYWYEGRYATANRLYKIIPNESSVWDIELFQWAPGYTPLIPTSTSGINGRLKYIPELRGFIINPDGIGPFYLVRTS